MKATTTNLLFVLSTLIALTAFDGRDVRVLGDPAADLNCKKTDIAGKCGENSNENPTQCGGCACYGQSHVFGNITNCIGGGTGGLKSCSAGTCKDTTITRECQADGRCKVTGTAQNDVIPTSYASGDACGNGGPQLEPVESVPVDPPPGG